MIIRDMFEKDINRSINGVIKVSQDDERSIKQELSEYVVTREPPWHFAHFFESYSRASTCLPIKSACGFRASLAVVNRTS